jgi:hypothetical protein
MDGQCFNELVAKDRYTVSQFVDDGFGVGPLGNHQSTPINEQRAIRHQEVL